MCVTFDLDVKRGEISMKVGLIQSIRLPNQSLRIMAEILREYDIDPIPLIIGSGLVPEILDDPWGSLNGHQELAFQRLFW